METSITVTRRDEGEWEAKLYEDGLLVMARYTETWTDALRGLAKAGEERARDMAMAHAARAMR